MKREPRGKQNSGQSLIAQGEPMVWISGGMFAIACTMIVALLSLILYQGLSTLWPKQVALFALEDDSIVGGEWISNQRYEVNEQTLDSLPMVAKLKAKQALGDNPSYTSDQFYLRTGNYDSTGKHFAFIPRILVKDEPIFYPRELWSVERKEWGVLFGFPTLIESSVLPDFDSKYAERQVLVQQIERFRPTEESLLAQYEAFTKDLENAAVKDAEQVTLKLRENRNAPDRIVDSQSFDEHLQLSSKRLSIILNRLDRAKVELGELDHRLSSLRLQVRAAELAEKSDVQSFLDEGVQIAATLGTTREQWISIEESIQNWKSAPFLNLAEGLGLITKEVERLRDEEIDPLEIALRDWMKTNLEQLPVRSKRSIEILLAESERIAIEQSKINALIARLEIEKNSETLTFNLPILDAAEQGLEVPDSDVSRSDSRLVKQTQRGGEERYFWMDQNGQFVPLQSKTIMVADIVRWFAPNQLSWVGQLQIYVARWFEFLFGEPREAGVEGGFFPAIWGTVVMTLLMSMAVMPFGVMAALYMREYAQAGWVLSMIRISINNLAGVPSIVYGVFGLAFFCYTIGGYVDGGPVKAGFTPWPPATWFAACGATVVAGTVAFFLAFLGSGSPAHMSPFRKRVASFAGLFWIASLAGFIALLTKTPYFDGFYQASLPNPTFGKGCLLWASCTLALLTLPVVIVATEEALSAVPNSLREGSYACGAGKWQTLQRIVLPYARPGIITGFILSMARGAGEVAPMMLVGAIPLATELPLDANFPFFHGSRSFMHLGFQIFSLGFQSQNSEAAKPMVFTATLLLLTIVTMLNVAAIWLRANLRKRFQGSQF